MNQKKNRCAIYCRLSVDDGIDQESQSISNQKQVLTEYCLENKFKIVDAFIDDGYSGTSKRIADILEGKQFEEWNN
ncbi:MAG: recombinase family protein [Clostridia bacterium]|nr:recombinase family protein [Clostridia bacterium]